jgi:nickel/cobalt exporter
MFDAILALLVAAQTKISQSVVATINAFASSHDWGVLAAILPFGIAFGAIHALTPGHSKSVLASYVAGSRISALRGFGVAAMLSFTHILSAVLIALLALPIVSVSFTGAGRAPWLEDISRALLAGIGVWMIYRAWLGGSHHHDRGNAAAVGVSAGIIPCPLTLFTMVLAMSRGVWEAGIVFAAAFMLGVAFTLSFIALITIAARGTVAGLVARYGGRLDQFGRLLEGAAGAILLAIGLREILFR